MKIILIFSLVLSLARSIDNSDFPKCQETISKISQNYSCGSIQFCYVTSVWKTPNCAYIIQDPKKPDQRFLLIFHYLPDPRRRQDYMKSTEIKNSMAKFFNFEALHVGETGDFVYHIQEASQIFDTTRWLAGEINNFQTHETKWEILLNYWRAILAAHQQKKTVVDFYPMAAYGKDFVFQKSDMGMLCAREEGALVSKCGDFDQVDPVIYQSAEGAPADAAMDAYRFGTFLFSTSNRNARPFAGSTPEELLKNWEQGDYTLPKVLNVKMAYMIALCLCKDRSKRQDLKFLDLVLDQAIHQEDLPTLTEDLAINNSQDPDELDIFKGIASEVGQKSGGGAHKKRSIFGTSADFFKDTLENSPTVFWSTVAVLALLSVAIVAWAFWPSNKPEGPTNEAPPSAPAAQPDPNDPKLDVELTNG